MKKKRFFALFGYFDYATDKISDADKFVERLVKEGVFKVKDIKFSEELKKLNTSYNGEGISNIRYLFSSFIRDNKCYYLSDKYLEEASTFIINKAIEKGEKHLQNKIDEYKVDDEGFFDLEAKKKFYKSELSELLKLKKSIIKNFGDSHYDYNSGNFSAYVKDTVKRQLHSDTDFNQRYITAQDDDELIHLPYQFNLLKSLVYTERLIEHVKLQIQKKDLKSASIETFTTAEAVCFFERIGFLRDESIISKRKQAKIISKLTGKNEANIRKAMSKLENKDSEIRNSYSKIEDYLNKMEYPLE